MSMSRALTRRAGRCVAIVGLFAPTLALAGAGEAALEGSLARDDVRDTVRDNISDVRGCYNNALGRDSSAAGELSIHAKIAADGRVGWTKVKSSSLANLELEACIAAAFGTWQFPAASGESEVVYPFVLSPG